MNLDHPCKETCSGWKQGFERGVESTSGISKQRIRFAEEIATLNEKIKDYEQALKFYGQEMNYSVDDYHGISGEMRKRCVLYSDCEERNEVYSYAGMRAREVLKKWSAV